MPTIRTGNPEAELYSQVNLDAPGGWGILMRHGERLPITKENGGYDAPLTDKGREDARDFGRVLPLHSIAGVYASPVERCIETAALILEGAGIPFDEARRKVHVEKFLVTAFVSDGPLAREQYMTRDPHQMVLDHLRGENIPGFRTVPEGVPGLLKFAADKIIDGRLSLFVTHDALIMPIIQECRGVEFNDENWLPCLSGTVLHLQDHSLTVDGVATTIADRME